MYSEKKQTLKTSKLSSPKRKNYASKQNSIKKSNKINLSINTNKINIYDSPNLIEKKNKKNELFNQINTQENCNETINDSLKINLNTQQTNCFENEINKSSNRKAKNITLSLFNRIINDLKTLFCVCVSNIDQDQIELLNLRY